MDKTKFAKSKKQPNFEGWKTTTTMKNKGCKWLGPWAFKQIWEILFLTLLGMADLTKSKQQIYYTPNSQQTPQKQPSFVKNQFIVFDEIREMASQMMHIHVNVSLNPLSPS
jgi:hypothetical protein